jgi:hypothetical protein
MDEWTTLFLPEKKPQVQHLLHGFYQQEGLTMHVHQAVFGSAYCHPFPGSDFGQNFVGDQFQLERLPCEEAIDVDLSAIVLGVGASQGAATLRAGIHTAESMIAKPLLYGDVSAPAQGR